MPRATRSLWGPRRRTLELAVPRLKISRACDRPLSHAGCVAVAGALAQLVADVVDLSGQLRLAPFTMGAPVRALGGVLIELATTLAESAGAIAERAIELGGDVSGTARQVAARSKLPDWPDSSAGDELTRMAERIEVFLANARDTHGTACAHGDAVSSELVANLLRELEGHAWSVRASLAS